MSIKRDIPATNEITLYMHCKLCLSEKPGNISPRDYSQIECGWTELGFQVWCKRHECNICHVDFELEQHPANLDRIKRPDEKK